MTVQIEIKEETVLKLRAVAQTLRLSLDEYLSKVAELLPLPLGSETQTTHQEAVHSELQPDPNLLEALKRIAERQAQRPFIESGDSLKMLRDARAGAMFGYEPTE